GTSMTPVACWPRAAVAVPTVKVARSCAAVGPTKTNASMTAVAIRRDILHLPGDDSGDVSASLRIRSEEKTTCAIQFVPHRSIAPVARAPLPAFDAAPASP